MEERVEKNEKPTWAVVIAIAMLGFGALGLMRGAQLMATPALIEFQRTMISGLAQDLSKHTDQPSITVEPGEGEAARTFDVSDLFSLLEQHLELPDWYLKWVVWFGVVTLVVSMLYALAGVLLLMARPLAVHMLYVALGVSIFWALVQMGIYAGSTSMLVMSMLPGLVVSVLIDILLIVVIALGDKSWLRRGPQES